MDSTKRAGLIILLITTLVAATAYPCTNFCAPLDRIFGRNYDFEIGTGMVIVNKRGLTKQSLSADGPASWTSRFSSVTFNQFGRDVPMDGMNERGLVVALAWLDATRYPAADSRPAVNELEWIQYQLDTASTVDEVIAQARAIRIVPVGSQIHYLVADRNGDAAVVEFLDGQLVAHTSLSAPAISNDTYADSVSYLDRLRATHETPKTDSSLDRFARAAMLLDETRGDRIAHAFEILAAVAESNTRWSIVYDQLDLSVHYRTDTNGALRTVRLASFDGTCATDTMVIDVDAGGGDVTATLVPYTFAANLALARRSFRGTAMFSSIPDAFIEMVARHPEDAICTAARRRAARH